MAFEKVEVDTWKPVNKDDSIEGIFIKAERDVGTNKSMLYNIDVAGKPNAVWGSAILDPKMVAVKTGDLIRIVFTGKGEAKGGHNAPKLFDVYIDYEHRDKMMADAEPTAEQPAVTQAESAPTPAAPTAEQPAPVAPATPTQATPA